VSAKAVSAKAVSAKAVSTKAVSTKAVSAKAVSAIDLHKRFPFLTSRHADEADRRVPELCQEGRYAGALYEVTQKAQQEEDMS
jgi:hypothetical protein